MKTKLRNILEWLFIFPSAVNRKCSGLNDNVRKTAVFLAWLVYISLILMIAVNISAYINRNLSGLYVTIEYTSRTDQNTGEMYIGAASNLPEGTRMLIMLTNEAGQNMKAEFAMGKYGVGLTPVSVFDSLPDGKYEITIEMIPPFEQPDTVQNVIGKNGDNLRGEYAVRIRGNSGDYKTISYKQKQGYYIFN